MNELQEFFRVLEKIKDVAQFQNEMMRDFTKDLLSLQAQVSVLSDQLYIVKLKMENQVKGDETVN